MLGSLSCRSTEVRTTVLSCDCDRTKTSAVCEPKRANGRACRHGARREGLPGHAAQRHVVGAIGNAHRHAQVGALVHFDAMITAQQVMSICCGQASHTGIPAVHVMLAIKPRDNTVEVYTHEHVLP